MGLIFLNKGDILFNDPNKVVCESGDYDFNQLVLVGETNNPKYPPDFPLYQYPAIYIKYGVFNEEDLNKIE